MRLIALSTLTLTAATMSVGCSPQQPVVDETSTESSEDAPEVDVDVPGMDLEVQADEEEPTVDVDLESEQKS
ncbi:MAG: hypothetical protein HUJ26_06925 [Planctomycetaceae bacterium]|nr:hypothetical protein [Planctomycetaceae bacterium]